MQKDHAYTLQGNETYREHIRQRGGFQTIMLGFSGWNKGRRISSRQLVDLPCKKNN